MMMGTYFNILIVVSEEDSCDLQSLPAFSGLCSGPLANKCESQLSQVFYFMWIKWDLPGPNLAESG